ncbi:type II toxin-antitoxin system RelE/ParE family toxin [Geminocystis sp. GBBB08]|uniref:type II toxin-antitoxin system RelE/ParE family toxin n=1 Tax=Geminocystis sp. GBBB08 TaxID=2604140 RepID=UPI0027E33A05|nr:type II toxin-antitoxin system RelE/ParE family toxin [Geminocystis sp. GBBB08]MBL1209143.1 type II toxin-antitoxin system RelE/ParE family toxin [Geminocystis sp. GBBB08]
MKNQSWEIKKYVTDDEICPFDEWFNQLGRDVQIRIDARFTRISLGNFGDYKSIEDGVFELRFHFGAGYRIYYGLDGKNIVILLIGGSKKKQNSDIKKALNFWQQYKQEKGDN